MIEAKWELFKVAESDLLMKKEKCLSFKVNNHSAPLATGSM